MGRRVSIRAALGARVGVETLRHSVQLSIYECVLGEWRSRAALLSDKAGRRLIRELQAALDAQTAQGRKW